MDVKAIRRANLSLLLGDERGNKTALAKRTGKAPSQISQWLSGFRTISEQTAREIEASCHKPHLWMDAENHAGVYVAQDMSLVVGTVPPLLDREQFEVGQLPQEFMAAMPDGALEPNVPKGTRLVFDTTAAPEPGHGVLVEVDGKRHVRRFVQTRTGWAAEAINPAYATFENPKVLAAMTGRMQGNV